MKTLRFTLPFFLLSLATAAFAQHEMQTSATQPPSDAQKSFAELKSLAGTWRGTVSTNPPQADIGKDPVWVTMRVTSRGNALVHEFKKPGTPDDTTKDDPITTFYVEGDRLLLTHYCDAGNRPRMAARTSPDGNTIEFDFVDLSGSNEYGHMYQAIFTRVDANHHTEDWTYMEPGNKPMHAHIELTRVQ